MKFSLFAFLLLISTYWGFGQNCTLSVNLTSPGTAICSGNSIVLAATASGGTAPYTYTWSTGETTPSISVNKAGTYTVTVSDQTPGCQPVKKSIAITSSITPVAPTASNVTVCQNSNATLTATSPGGVYQWYDANGNFLASGATYTTAPITATTTFYVQTTVNGCTGPSSAVTAFVYGPPGSGNTAICAGGTATISAAGYSSYIWYDAPTGGNQLSTNASYTTPSLLNTTTYYVAGVVNGCITGRNAVTVFVTPAPQPPTASGATVCSGSSASLHADAPAGNIDWFDVPTGGTSLITSPDFTTPPLNTTTTYYVQATTNCVSTRTPVTVTVTQIPQAPTVPPVTICPGTSAHLSATTSVPAAFNWYARSSGGAVVATGATFDTPNLAQSTTYYVEANNGGCVSSRTAVPVTVTPPPTAPTAAGALICSGSSVVLTATAPGGTYQWYDAPTGGNLLVTNASYTTPALIANTTYYVQTTASSGCISNRTAVTVSILPVVPPPTAPGTTICTNSIATLTASGGSSFQWYDAAAGGNLLANTATFTTPVLSANTTYYVLAIVNGCTSTRTPVTVTVNAIPAAPTASGTSVCAGSTATLTASAPVGTIAWYDAATGGSLLANGNTYTTPPIVNATTFYAQANTATCSSSRTPVMVTLITGASPQFQYPSNTVCAASGTVTPVINNPAGGTFSASPAGLVFSNTTTGAINVSASLPGTYTISFTNNPPCPVVVKTTFTIALVNNAQFAYSGPFCQGGTDPLPVFPAGSSAGTFTASPAGLVFVDTSSGQIDLAKSAPGTYSITNTIPASGTCGASIAVSSVTIFQQVTISAGPNQVVPPATPVQLAGSISGGASTGTWTGGAGTFSDPSLTNAVYTPAAGETSVTLTLTSADPPGPCGAVSATMTITVSPVPVAPTVAGATICSGSTATLTPTAPGGAYNWYTTATGGSSFFTGSTYTTPSLTANTTYYVSATINGVTGARTAVTVTVTTTAPPVVAVPAVCLGSTASLTATGPAGAVFNWYDAAVNGNYLIGGPTYTTGALNANASFFVDATVNGCTSARTEVDVVVTPLPNITSANASDVCSGAPLNYTITADNAAATFLWSRAAVAGIGNSAVTNQTSANITEMLINNTPNAINVTYIITAIANGCSSTPFNYIVTVYPAPVVTSAATATICNGTSTNYSVSFSVPQTGFTWDRAAVTGISNAAVSGQTAATLHEVLFNTTNAPVNVIYTYNYSAGPCAGTAFNFVVTVNPSVGVTSAANAGVCTGTAQNYIIASNVPSATFNWGRAAVQGISNAAVSNQTSGTITEALINTGTSPVPVQYVITPTAFGCQGAPFSYTVTVNPIPVAPVANGNSPVCVGSTIQLRTPLVANATYLWAGPGGYTSTQQNADITNVTVANTGNYQLFVTINGCTSPPATVAVTVDPPPVANAGPNQTSCISTATVQLAGSVTGGTTTGIWSTAGSGTFLPAENQLNAVYAPSAQDKAAGSVVLTLVSTSKDDCSVSSSNMTITFATVPAADAGPDQTVCAQTSGVTLAGKILIPSSGVWTTSGTGSFAPSASQLNATYVPGAADIAAGSVTLTLTASSANNCYIPADQMVINFIPPPTVYAGGTRYVLKNNTITLTPTVSDPNVTYLWSPNVDISDPTIKNPIVTGNKDRTYTLTVTDVRGCVASDTTRIKVSPAITVNNTFTPNGDGINDTWDIVGLIAYQNATVDIFNRNGTPLFHSIGYPVPWDGTFNNLPVPVGVYFYIINTNVNHIVLSGSVTVIR